MTEIVLEGISKSIGGKPVLRDINLKIESGDIVIFLGPAGSGKTALLKIIAGTERPDHGRVYFDNQDVTFLPPQKRNVGMVFQTFALYPNLTVFENIASPLRVRKVGEEEIKKKVKEVAEMLNISHILPKRPHEISGGEAQRTAIARALVKGSKVILFDEPLTNLDYKVRETLRFELKKLFTAVKTTTIYSTSNPEEAAALGKTLVHIRGGRIIQHGPVKECFERPTDVVAANMYSPVGANVFEAKCLVENSRKILRVNELFKIDVTASRDIIEGEEYKLGVYPHDIKLFAEHPETMVEIPVTVELIENMGSELVVVLRCGEHVINVLSSDIQKLHIMDKAKNAYISMSDIMIFSKEGLYLKNLI